MKNWIKEHPIKMFMVILIVILPLMICYQWEQNALERRIERIPEPVKVSERIISDVSFIDGCGIEVFSLTEDTIIGIKEKGIEYFKVIPMEWPEKDGSKSIIHYSAWQETPVPKNEVHEGSLGAEFQCAKYTDKEWKNKILKAALSLGGYYYRNTFQGDFWIIILPNQKLLIQTF